MSDHERDIRDETGETLSSERKAGPTEDPVCANCGHRIEPDDIVCPNCGISLASG